MTGLIHLYCGDGKGKTTAAVGLAVRAASSGLRVVFAQFFKDGTSSELSALRSLPTLRLFYCPTHYGLWKNMDAEKRIRAASDYSALLERALCAAQTADLLVLDEVCSACTHGVISQQRLCDFLLNRPSGLEVALTGRDPSPRLLELSDYVTEMRKLRHPFDRGIPARKGIEF